MSRQILQAGLLLGLVLMPAAGRAQSALATSPHASSTIAPGDGAAAQARVAARIANDSSGRKDYRVRGAIIGGLGLGIAAGVVLGGLCSMASESPDSSCTEVAVTSGVLGGLIGAGIGAMIGSAIPRQRPIPADSVRR